MFGGFFGFSRRRAALAAALLVCTGCTAKTSREGSSELTAGFQLSPAPASVALWQTQAFAAADGTPPYTYAVAGGGTIDASGNFTAPGVPGTSTITATDATGLTASLPVTVTMGQHVFPNDPDFLQLWPFTGSAADLGFTAAWATAHDCTAIPIGIVDSGVDPNHPDLAANLNLSLASNFVTSNSSVTDGQYYGTSVAGAVGAVGNNALGVTGVCWTAKLVPLVAVDSSGNYNAAAAEAAIAYAAQNGIMIVVLSWEDESWQDTAPSGDLAQFTAAIQGASSVLVIASAGDGDDPQTAYAGLDIDEIDNQVYPGSLAQSNSNLLTVAAVDRYDHLASYSNYGNQSVQLAAPGDLIGTTLPTYQTSQMTTDGVPQSYGLISGSSMAAAYVAGAAALAWAQHPELTAAALKQRILDKADDLPGLTQSVEQGRRLNAGHLILDP